MVALAKKALGVFVLYVFFCAVVFMPSFMYPYNPA